MRRWRAACLAALISLAGCSPQEASEQPVAKLPKLRELQRLATLDCQCRLAGKDGSRHGREFARLIEPLTREASATSSVPVSYEADCFPALGENACVLTGGYLPPDSGNFVCTEAQGIELEKLWAGAYARRASVTEADETILRRLDQMRSDARKSVREQDCT